MATTTVTEAESSTTGHPQRWRILWILCGSMVLVVISVSSLNVALPAIQRSLDASGSELQWIVASYALVFAGLLLPAGAIGDRYGRRRALLGGLAVFGMAAVGGALATDSMQLIVWRAVMGAGAAFIMPATLSIIATVFPEGERDRAIAIWAGFAGAGGAIGLIASGLLVEAFGWQSVMLVNLPVVVAMVLAVVAWVPDSRDEDGVPLDLVGSALAIAGLVALVYSFIEGPESGGGSVVAPAPLLAAAVLLAAFVLWELRVSNPLLDPRLFRVREFSLGSLTISVAFFGMFGMFFLVTQYFQFVQGHSALAAGMRLLPYGLVLLVVTPRAAALSARHGARVVVTAGLVIAAVGFVVLGVSRPETPYLVSGVALVVLSIGIGLLMPPATSALVAALPPSKAGVGSAMNDVTREVGGVIGIAVVGALVSLGYRRSLGDSLDSLPESARETATDSIGGFLGVTPDLPAVAVESMTAAATNAFTDGVRLGMFAAAAALVVTAGAVAVAYPRARKSPSPSTTQNKARRS